MDTVDNSAAVDASSSATSPSPSSSPSSLYSLSAYTRLTAAQAQLCFDAFRPNPKGRWKVEEAKELLGGLSNSNYRLRVLDTRHPNRPAQLFLLKICEEKEAAEVEAQVRALHLIRQISRDPNAMPQVVGEKRPCPIAYPLAVGEEETEGEGVVAEGGERGGPSSGSQPRLLFHVPAVTPRPLVVYQYISGTNVRSASEEVMGEIARAQAYLHAVPVDLPGRSFDFLPQLPFGMFAIRQQHEQHSHKADEQESNGNLTAPSAWRHHSFLSFLQPHLPELDRLVSLSAQLPPAVCHCDLFYENVMFDDKGEKLLALIDFEEMGLGPRLLDVCMTVVGCCYDRASNQLDFSLLRAFLHSYARSAPLPFTPLEQQSFLSFLVYGLLAIGYWRFQHFNIVHPPPNPRQDAYLEMQQRVEQLQQPDIRQAIEQIIQQEIATDSATHTADSSQQTSKA